jgi:hypothetical protein
MASSQYDDINNLKRNRNPFICLSVLNRPIDIKQFGATFQSEFNHTIDSCINSSVVISLCQNILTCWDRMHISSTFFLFWRRILSMSNQDRLPNSARCSHIMHFFISCSLHGLYRKTIREPGSASCDFRARAAQMVHHQNDSAAFVPSCYD